MDRLRTYFQTTEPHLKEGSFWCSVSFWTLHSMSERDCFTTYSTNTADILFKMLLKPLFFPIMSNIIGPADLYRDVLFFMDHCSMVP